MHLLLFAFTGSGPVCVTLTDEDVWEPRLNSGKMHISLEATTPELQQMEAAALMPLPPSGPSASLPFTLAYLRHIGSLFWNWLYWIK